MPQVSELSLEHCGDNCGHSLIHLVLEDGCFMSLDGVKEAEDKNRKRVASFREEQWGGRKKKKSVLTLWRSPGNRTRATECGFYLIHGSTCVGSGIIFGRTNNRIVEERRRRRKESPSASCFRRAGRVQREGGRRDAPIGGLSPVSSAAAGASTWGKEAGNTACRGGGGGVRPTT